MAPTLPPLPVKYFVAVLYREPPALDHARDLIAAAWGVLDIEGADHPFNVTDYYQPEMGPGLMRRLLAIGALYAPTLLVEMKLRCNGIEDQLAVAGKRTVNLDAGYLDHNKVLLASAKEAGQKIYLDKGIYADLAGRYKAGKYQPFEWSFPDFRDGRYDAELLKMRARYLEQIREWKAGKG
jgi:hypothetical protein